jgi:hypothetical protein
MNNNDTALVDIYDLLKDQNDESKAKVFGINKNADYDFRQIASHGDIYQLVDDIIDDRIGSMYDYLGLITYGWAAPLNQDGELEDGQAPSEHPNRRRVRLLLVTSKEIGGVLGSAMEFVNEDEDPIFDYAEASGPLNDHMSKIYGDN